MPQFRQRQARRSPTAVRAQLLTLPPRNTTERFPVETRASGTFPLNITVTTEDGRLPLHAARYTVRSTVVSGVGIFLTIGAGALPRHLVDHPLAAQPAPAHPARDARDVTERSTSRRRAPPRPLQRGRRARHRALADHRLPPRVRARGARLRAAHRRLQHRELDAEHRLRAAARRHPHRDARPALRRALREATTSARPTRSTPSRSPRSRSITVLGFLAAPWIIDLYMLRLHGAGKAAQQALATDLLRWFMPQIFFYGVTALATAMLNARRRFAAAAFAPVLNNVVVIAVLLALPSVASEPPTVTQRAPRPGARPPARARHHGRHRGDGARAAPGAAARRRPAALGLGVAPPRRAPARPALGLDDRLRRDEPGRVLGRAVPRVRAQRRRVGLPRRVHVLPASARAVRGVDHDRARARSSRAAPSRGDFDGLRDAVRDGVPAHGARRAPRGGDPRWCSRDRS